MSNMREPCSRDRARRPHKASSLCERRQYLALGEAFAGTDFGDFCANRAAALCRIERRRRRLQ
jgi:hypothetical protein